MRMDQNGIALASLFCVAFWSMMPCSAQDADAPDLNFAHFRIVQLERQIADRIARSTAANDIDRKVIDAQINFRIVARSLLQKGRAAGSDGSIAALYGHTLVDHLADADALFAKLPVFVQVVRDLKRPTDDPTVAAAKRFNASMDQFAKVSQKAADRLAGVDAEAVDSYLHDMLTPLTVAHEAAGGTQLGTAWPRAIRSDSDGAVLADSIDLDDIESLRERIGGLSVRNDTKREMLLVVAMMRQGFPHPDIRPHVLKFYDLMEQAAAVARAFGGASSWLGDDAAAELLDQLHTAVLLVKEPRTRDSGVARFEALSRSLDMMERIAELDQQAVPIRNIRAVFLKAHELRVSSQDIRTAEDLTRFVEQVTAPMLTYRYLLGTEPHPSVRKMATQLGGAYQQEELRIINEMAALVTDPTAVRQTEWKKKLETLDDRLNRFRRVQQIPRWVDVMSEHKPKPAGGLFRRLTGLANDLTNRNPDRAAAADAALALIDEHAELFLPLPYVEHLKRGGDDVQDVTGGAYSLILDQIDRQRHLLATAWASDGDPEPSAEALRKIKRLLNAIHLTLSVGGVGEVGERLNRWSAWQASVAAVRPLIAVLPDRVRQACRFAAVANFIDLETQLQKIERESALPLLVARLAQDLSGALNRLPDGAAAMLGQCLFPPGDEAYGVSQRDTLARVSIYLMEAGHASRGKDPRRYKQLLDHVAAIAEQLLSEVEQTGAIDVVLPAAK